MVTVNMELVEEVVLAAVGMVAATSLVVSVFDLRIWCTLFGGTWRM
jgi:hypothetical protein